MAAPDPQRYLVNLQDEIDGTALYRALAEIEADASLSAIYGRLAEARSATPNSGGRSCARPERQPRRSGRGGRGAGVDLPG